MKWNSGRLLLAGQPNNNKALNFFSVCWNMLHIYKIVLLLCSIIMNRPNHCSIFMGPSHTKDMIGKSPSSRFIFITTTGPNSNHQDNSQYTLARKLSLSNKSKITRLPFIRCGKLFYTYLHLKVKQKDQDRFTSAWRSNWSNSTKVQSVLEC